MTRLILTTAAALALASASLADELRRSSIPADASMVLHFDFEGFRRTSLWQMLLEHEDFDIAAELDELEDIRREFGIDPLTDVRSVTVYGRDDAEPHAALVTVNDRIDTALHRMRDEEDYRSFRSGGLDLHSWDDGGDSVFAYVHPLRSGDRVLVLSDSPERVIDGARVLAGERESLADVRAPRLDVRPNRGSFLYVAAADLPSLHDIEPASQLFGLAQGIQFDLGEAGGLLFAQLAVVTESDEDARNLADMGQGLIAMARLVASGQAEIPDVAIDTLDSIQINRRGNEISVGFELDVRRVMDELEALGDF